MLLDTSEHLVNKKLEKKRRNVRKKEKRNITERTFTKLNQKTDERIDKSSLKEQINSFANIIVDKLMEEYYGHNQSG
jgi:hypothetical protein